MVKRPILDLDLLHTLVVLAEEASFTRTATRVGRTQSAVTLQIQKLEDAVQQPLVIRAKGGPVELTPQGRALLETARAMLALNDQAFQVVRTRDMPETIRLGTSVSFTPCYLQKTLETIRSLRPNVLVEVTEGYSCQLAPQIKDGAFDLVVCEGGHEPRGWQADEIFRGPLRWVTSTERSPHRHDPVPLSLPPGNCPWRPAWMDDCYWRSAALHTLERAGLNHRIVSAAASMDGLYGPVIAGEAIMVATGAQLPPGLRVLQDDEGLPALPDFHVVVIKSRSSSQPLTDIVAATVRSTFSLT